MDFLYTAVNSVLSALFLYYILILIFGNSKGKIPFVIYLLVTVGRTIFEVVFWLSPEIPVYFPIVFGVIMLIPHLLFLIMMIRRFGLFNINIRGYKFKRKTTAKEIETIVPLAKRRRLILLIIGIVSFLIFATLLSLLLSNLLDQMILPYLIVVGIIMVATIIILLLLRMKPDQIVLIIGRLEKRVFVRDLLKKEYHHDLFKDDRYFLDYAGLAYVKDEQRYTTILHVFILNNDAEDFKMSNLVLDKSALAAHIISDFEKYKVKSVFYRVNYREVIKIREE